MTSLYTHTCPYLGFLCSIRRTAVIYLGANMEFDCDRELESHIFLYYCLGCNRTSLFPILFLPSERVSLPFNSGHHIHVGQYLNFFSILQIIFFWSFCISFLNIFFKKIYWLYVWLQARTKKFENFNFFLISNNIVLKFMY